jgi:hypothetical protein
VVGDIAVIAADATAAAHVVAEESATVAVVAALVAIGSTAARTPVAATTPLARASGKNSGGQNKTNAEYEFHGQTDVILYSSAWKTKGVNTTGVRPVGSPPHSALTTRRIPDVPAGRSFAADGPAPTARCESDPRLPSGAQYRSMSRRPIGCR